MSAAPWLPLLVWGEPSSKAKLLARWAQLDQDHFYFHSPWLFAAPASLGEGADGSFSLEPFELESCERLNQANNNWPAQWLWELFKRGQDALAQREELDEASCHAPKTL